MVMVLFCFMYLYRDDTNSHPGHLSPGSGGPLSFLLFVGVWGLWMIVRGLIYLIRALSGNEQYGKRVEDAMDKSFGSSYEAMTKRRGNASTRNVAVLLGWVFLFLAIAGAIFIGYLFLTRPR
jgi:hypothetical protein